MAYIGKSIESGTFALLDTSGNTYNGSNTTFSLGTQVGSPAQLLVSHDGVLQKPGTDYSLASGGTQITFSTAPASGASIFIVEISGAVGGPLDSDLNGSELILDADGDTSITADTDDQIDIKVAGADDFQIVANNFKVLSGSTLTVESGATITNSGTANGFGALAGIDDQSSSNDDQLTITDTAVVINEDSDDVDFRVESNGNTNMLLVDAGNDRVKVGADTGIGQLNISGSGSTTMTSSFYSDSHADISGNPCIEIHNSDTTDNNFSSIVFVESSGSANGAISCVNGNPGGNGGGELVFLTRNSGDSSDTLTHNGRMFNDGDFVIGSQNNDPDGTKGAYIDYSGFFVAHQDTSNASPLLFRGISNHGGTEEPKVEMTADGSFKSRNNNYTSFSDERIKKNITDAKSQWDDIKSINFKNFKFKTEDGSSGATLLGVIAQDLEKTSPNLVESTDPSIADIIRSSEFGEVEDDINRPKTYENPDELPSGKKVGDLILDESGNKIYKKKIKSLTGEKVKVVKYSVLYLKAVKALQEAMTRIETLETKVKTLEEG